jgi:hypothetical protein
LIQLIHSIPFHQYPGQAVMLVAPGLFVVVMILHIVAAAYKYKAGKGEQTRGH